MAPDPIPSNKQLAVSFEFFPPKTAAMEETLWRSVERLAPLAPDFVSVTYGAGGSTRQRTHATIARILSETALAPAAHLTCVGASRAEIDSIIREYKKIGVQRIVALRGDPPTGAGTKYEPHPDGYAARPSLSQESAKSAASRSRWRPIRKSIPIARRSTPTLRF